MAMLPNKSFQRTVKKLRFLPSAEFARWAYKSQFSGFVENPPC